MTGFKLASSTRIRVGCLVAWGLVLMGSLVACGGEATGDRTSSDAPRASDFPSATGRTIGELLDSLPASDLVVSPAVSVVEVGVNRFSFGVFELDASQADEADVALYFARGAKSEVKGPFPSRADSLETKPAFAAQGSKGPDEATTVYVVDNLRFDRPGPWMGVAVIDGEDGPEVTRIPSVDVGRFPGVAQLDQRAPKVSTPTMQSVGGDLAKIDTRQPPSSMHDVDLVDVLGKKPVVLNFATPALCQTRVCGPVVDITEQVKAEVGEGVAFIHQEVYNENDPNKGVRPQLKAYGLQTEPWIFLIGRDGRIKQRIEGAYGVDELRTAVLKLKKLGD